MTVGIALPSHCKTEQNSRFYFLIVLKTPCFVSTFASIVDCSITYERHNTSETPIR